jgi:hypothetical protein
VLGFAISFDSRGKVAGQWNVPPHYRLNRASDVPDLGAGLIGVAVPPDVVSDSGSIYAGAADTFSRISAAGLRKQFAQELGAIRLSH